MIKRFFVGLSLLALAFVFFQVASHYTPLKKLGPVASHYVTNGPNELGAANIVTAVIVTYRGLDTLGEVVVLFISATGVGLLLRRRKEDEDMEHSELSEPSILVKVCADFLVPLIFLFGTYIFMNGHLTPGGGFQGGAVIASGVVLLYVMIGVLGLIFAGGFLDNRFLSLGEYGQLFSAGAIPLIYIIIGLKVGTELSVVLEDLREE